MIEQIKYELEKRKLISDLIISALEKTTEKSTEKTRVGKVQSAIYKVLKIEKTWMNNRMIDSVIQSHGVERMISTGKWYYKNISVKESYGT